MRLAAIAVIGVFVAFRSTPPAVPAAPDVDARDAAAATAPQIEQLLVPIYARGRSRSEGSQAAYWGSLPDGEVFREIRDLSREGLVQNAGQPAAPVRIIREFFAPGSDLDRQVSGLLGHYVFIVECTKSDLKHVTGITAK